MSDPKKSDPKKSSKIKWFQIPKLSEMGYLGLVVVALMAFASLSGNSAAYQEAVLYSSIIAGGVIFAADRLFTAPMPPEVEIEEEGTVTVFKPKSSHDNLSLFENVEETRENSRRKA